MPTPNFTPNGRTVNVDRRPSQYNLGTVTLKGERESVEIDLTTMNPRPDTIIFDTPVKFRLLEATP
jgi:hypothetical protein